MSGVKLAIDAILGLVIFGIILYMTYVSTKYVGKRYSLNGKGGKNLKIIESLGVGKDSNLLLVKVGEKTLLVGVTSQSINLVNELSEDDILLQTENLNDDLKTPIDFASALKYNIAKKFGKPEKSDAEEENENDKKSDS